MNDRLDMVMKLHRAHIMSCSDPRDPSRVTMYSAARDTITTLMQEKKDVWDQAHDVFCPRGSACSTHLKQGDRWLLGEKR